MGDWRGEESWLASLPASTRKIVESVDLRNHRVDLERVQRIHLDIDDEEMEFSASTVAAMIEDISDQCEEHEAFLLRAVVNALRGQDDHHILTLKQKKPGKFVSPHEYGETHNRNAKWLWWLAHRETNGIKTEAAIAEIAEAEKVSRAAVFAGVKAAEDFLSWGRELDPTCANFQSPRPAKKRNT